MDITPSFNKLGLIAMRMMSKVRPLLCVSIALVALLSPSIARGATPYAPESFTPVFDTQTMARTAYAAGFQVFALYVVAFDLPGISAWESSLSILADWSVIQTHYSTPGALDVGGQVGNYIVGLGECTPASRHNPLLTLDIGYFGSPFAPETEFCVGPAVPSSVGGAAPAYVDCDDNLLLFDPFYDPCYYWAAEGCAVVNSTETPPVTVEASSVGTFKATAGTP